MLAIVLLLLLPLAYLSSFSLPDNTDTCNGSFSLSLTCHRLEQLRQADLVQHNRAVKLALFIHFDRFGEETVTVCKSQRWSSGHCSKARSRKKKVLRDESAARTKESFLLFTVRSLGSLAHAQTHMHRGQAYVRVLRLV